MVSQSCCRAPFGAHEPDIYYCMTVTVLFLWGALSAAGTGLSLFLYIRMLLALASAIFLGPESLGTRGHILLSQI
jgi:hypothetical protein